MTYLRHKTNWNDHMSNITYSRNLHFPKLALTGSYLNGIISTIDSYFREKKHIVAKSI